MYNYVGLISLNSESLQDVCLSHAYKQIFLRIRNIDKAPRLYVLQLAFSEMQLF